MHCALLADDLDLYACLGAGPGLIRSQSGDAEFSCECQAGAIPKREAEGPRGGS